MQSVFLVAVAALVRQQESPDEFGGETSMFVSQTGDSNFWGNGESLADGDPFSESFSDEMARGELGNLDLAPIAEKSASGERLALKDAPSGERLALKERADSEDAPARSLTTSQGEQLALERAEKERQQLAAPRVDSHQDEQLAPVVAAPREGGEGISHRSLPWPTGDILEICPIGGSDRDCGNQLKTLEKHVDDSVALKGVVVHGRYAAFKILGLQGNGKPGNGESWRLRELRGSEQWREHLETSGVPVLWFNKDEAAMAQVEQALGAAGARGDRWFSGSAMADYRAFKADPKSAATRPDHGNIREIA